MGLPREIIDEVMRYNNPQTVKACSLTSRSFYSAARPSIHKRLVLGMGSVIRGSSRKRLSYEVYLDRAEEFHARYLSAAEERGLLRYGYVREVYLDLNIGNPEKVLQLRQLRALETVLTLTIKGEDLDKILLTFNLIFDRCFSQFVPTLRSLRLESAWCYEAQKLTEFVCRFPHLDDLALINSRRLAGLDYTLGILDALPGLEGQPSQQPLPFGGHLAICGRGPLVKGLLDLPGGIRFQSIEASSSVQDLAKLLAECSSTLEVLGIRCFVDCKSGTLTFACVSTE